MAFDFSQYTPAAPQPQDGGGTRGFAPLPQGGGSYYQQMQSMFPQIQQANQAYQINMQDPYQQQANPYLQNQNQWSQDDYNLNRDRGFRLNGGTEDMYNGRYRRASLADTAAIMAGQGGEFLMNLPGEIAGGIAGLTGGDAEQAKKDWTFNANNFDLTNGFDLGDAAELGKFALSLPGMIPGGLLEGAERGWEAATGAPVREYRQAKDGGYEIADYQLDASQRAAAGVDALIDVAGTFTGGAGRVVGKVGEVAAKKAFKEAAKTGSEEALNKGIGALSKAQRTQQRFENMSKGMIERAWEGAGGKLPTGTIGQTAFDIANEASEEFIQSYADDIRMKNLDEGSLDRAMTGAAWGALGGGLMSVGVHAMNSRVNQGEPQSDTDNPGTEPHTEQSDWDRLRQFIPSRSAWSNSAQEAANNIYTQHRDAPGSGVFKQIGTDDTLQIDSIRLGDENLKQIFESSDRSAQKLASDFGTNVETLAEIFTNSDNIARDLNQLMDDNGLRGRIKVAVGRNPDTKNGAYYMDIDRIEHGQAFVTHPMVAAIVGSDWDGDQASVYFDPDRRAAGDNSKDLQINPLGYASQMLLDPEGGTNVDWWYAGFDKNVRANKNEINRIIREFLAPYTHDFDGTNMVSHYSDRLAEIIDMTDADVRNKELSVFFTELANDVDAFNANGEYNSSVAPDSLSSGRFVVNNLLKQITGNSDSIIAQYTTYQAEQVMNNILALEGNTVEQNEEAKSLIDDWERRGTLGENTKVFQMTKSLGLLSYALSEKGNAPYRQYGQLYYMTKSIPSFSDMVSGLSNIYTSESVINTLIRASFKMPQAGEAPAVAVESLCDTLCLSETWSAAGLSGRKLSNAQDVLRLMNAFAEAQKKYARVYNDAQKQLTQFDWEANVDSKYRNALTGSEDPEFMHHFFRIFQNVPMEELFDVSILQGSYKEGMTFGAFIEDIAKNSYTNDPNVVLAPLGSERSELKKFLLSAIRQYNSETKQMASRIVNIFTGINMGNIVARWEANGKKIDPQDSAAVLQLMDAINLVVDPEVCIDLGLIDAGQILDTKIGQMLFSGDENKIMNALTSASIRGQFFHLIEDYRSDDSQKVHNATVRLMEMRNISKLHQVIADQLLSANSTDVFDLFTNVDKSLEDKINEFNAIIGAAFPTENYIIDSLRSSNGDFDLSSISAKMKKSESALNKMKRLVIENIRDEVNDFKAMTKNGDESLVVSYITQRCQDIITQPNSDLLAMKLYASLTLDNSLVEKAVNADAAVMMYMSNQLGVNGNLVSHLDVVTGASVGHIDKANWASNRYHVLTCIIDPNYRQEVWDPETGKVTIMTQESLFRSIDPGFNSGDPITKGHILQLLDKYPQIAGYICEGGTNVIAQNGETGAQAARATSISEDYKRWLDDNVNPNAHFDAKVHGNMKRALGMTRSWLFNQSAAHKIITLMLDPDTMEGDVKTSKLSNDVNRKLDDLARYVYWRALQKGVGNGVKSDEALYNAQFRADMTNRLTTELWRAVAFANDQLEVQLQYNVADDMISKMMLGRLGNMRVVQKLKEYGIYANVPDISFKQSDAMAASFSDRIKEASERTMRAAEMITYVMMNGDTSGMREAFGSMVDRDAMVDSIYAELVQHEIDRGTDIAKIDKAKFRKDAEDFYNQAIEDASTFEFPGGMETFLLGEDDFKSPWVLREKLQQLYAFDSTLYENIDGDVDAVFKTGELNIKAKNDLIKTANMHAIREELSQIAQLNGMPINENALQLQMDTIDELEQLIEDFAIEMRQEGRNIFPTNDAQQTKDWFNDNHLSFDVLPQMDFFSQTKQSSITQQSVMDQSAGNPALVGVNGGMGKKAYPLGWLPAQISDGYSQAKGIRAGDLKDFTNTTYRNWRAINGDGEVVSVSSRGFQDYLATLGNDEEVVIYDPDDNPHGLPTYNMQEAEGHPRDGYHRLSGIIGRIIDFSQEAMVLKSKKNFKAVTKIVNNRAINNAGQSAVATGNLENASDAYENISAMFKKFRFDYMDSLTSEFEDGGSMDKLGFGEDQARILSQFLTPGVIVRVALPDGTSASRVIDASCFFGEDAEQKFLKRWTEITQVDPETGIAPKVISADILTVTIQEACSRVQNAVGNAYHDSNGNLSKQSAEEFAVNSLSDWTNYEQNLDGTVDSIMSAVTPLGHMFRGRITALDSPTPVQWFYNEVFQGATGAMVNQEIPSMHYYDERQDGSQPIKTQKVLGLDRPVLKAFNFDSETRLNQQERDLANLINPVRDMPENIQTSGYGICFDPTKLDKAAAWARKTGNGLWIRSEQVSSAKNWLGRKAVTTINKNINGIQFTLIRPVETERMMLTNRNMPTSSTIQGDKSRITAAVVVPSSMYNMGDAEMVAMPNQDNRTIRTDKTKSISVNSYLPKNNLPKRLLNRQTAAMLLDKVATKNSNGDWIPNKDGWDSITLDNGDKVSFELDSEARRNSKVSKNSVKHLIVDYLVDMSNENRFRDPQDSRPSVAMRSTVAGILSDGTTITPVFYPDTMPTNVYYNQVEVINGKVVISYSGETKLNDPGISSSQKWMLLGETFKGMVSRFRGSFIPRIVNGQEINFMVSADTEGSRVTNRELPLLKQALYYQSRMRDSSLFFDGNDVNQYIKDNWTADDIAMLKNGALDDEFWMRFVNNELNAIDPKKNPDAARAIRSAILQCIRFKVSPMYLFSTYRVIDNGDHTTAVRFGDSKLGNDGYMDVDYQMIFQNFNSDQMLTLYHAIDNGLCANGVQDSSPRESYIIDRNGMTLMQMSEGQEPVALPVRYGYHQVLGDSTAETTPSGESAISMQHVGRRGLDLGYLDSDMRDAIEYEDFIYGNNERSIESLRNRMEELRNRKIKASSSAYSDDSIDMTRMYHYGTLREIQNASRVFSLLKNTFSHIRMVYDNNDEAIKDFTLTKSGSKIKLLNGFLDNEWTFDQINYMTMFNDGSSWIEGAPWRISDSQFARSIQEIYENMSSNDRPMPVKVPYEDSSKANGRFGIPLITREMVDWSWNSSENIRKQWGTKQAYIDGIKEEQLKAENAIASIDESIPANRSRKKALTDMARAARLAWNDVSTVLPCYEDYTWPQIQRDENNLASALSAAEGWTKEQHEVFQDCCRMSEEKLRRVREYLERVGYKRVDVKGSIGDSIAYSKVEDAKFVAKILNNAAELSKVMAIANPFVTVANVTDRAIHQGIMNAAMQLGHKLKIGNRHVGPYGGEVWIDQSILDKAINDPVAINLYSAFRDAEFNSEDQVFVSQAIESGNIEALMEWNKQRKANLTRFGKVTEWMYHAGSGGNMMLKGQMRNFMNRFVMFAEETGQTFWFEPTEQMIDDGKGGERAMTYLEAKLAAPGGFAQVFMEMIGGRGIDASPSYTIAMQAMNSAKTGDMAQRNAVGQVLADICRRTPFGKFLMTTCVSRFPAYGINVTGRMLNWIMPISSINYVFTEYLSQTEYGQRIGVEETQIHRSLREAILVDITKLGVGGTAMVLFALSGAIQPPDDEKKWGNIDEWLFFGTRAGESWWVEDILGMALPLACFWKSAEQGKPRLDILTNGIAQACYSNPILRCTDVASFLINPSESLISDYNEDLKQFQNAKGGPPSVSQYVQANLFSLGMSWVSQFMTPSIVREWYQSATPLEKSYKKVYETGPTGQLTEEGILGKTVYTTYDEAMKRKLARRNPVLAALFEMTNGTGTSYFSFGMPDTVYYDDTQLNSNNAMSVQGLDDAERMAKVIEIIGIIQSYDDMDELAADGFHLDYETLSAVAQQVWDNYHAVDEWYYEMQANGQLDYYTLGNGDYTAGMEMAGQLKLERQQMKQYWYDFYYQKLKDSPIAGTLQTYNRYNTTYARDVNGEVYATGIQRSPFNLLPFTNAPGTLQDAENTAGYENDWATISAVTGLPMDQRALIPNTDGNIDMPDFEYWSGDGEGNKYSKQYQNIYGTVGDASNASSTTRKTTSGYPRSSGGYPRGGSGYRRGGGGGGGGRSYSSGAPNIYAPSVDISNPRASRIMNTDRIQRADLDYLRPDFETKGSREAYKRSDI